MGIFDTIKCEYPLPDGCTETKFQTKDLDPCLETYVLTKDGRLTLRGKDQEFHGDMTFYTVTKEDAWFEYKVRFTEGQLVRFLPTIACTPSSLETPQP